MASHHFIFSPGHYIGQCRLILSPAKEQITFYTSWQVDPLSEGKICCHQTIEMVALGERMENDIVISDIKTGSFAIVLENPLLGKAQGTGIISSSTIAWEFQASSGLDGFEIYKLQEDGDYHVHAEYASRDQLRTIIDGVIWKKESAPLEEKELE
jgi:hypothetical protein